ncbi:hypothetical protein GQ53DRAFT_613633, partial [Thozetella sp. PMI_491]
ISSHVSECLELFRSFIDTKISTTNVAFDTIRDEQTRFKVWSGNIGAHKSGMSSLDYRLRDSSNIKKQVIKLLQELAALLRDAIAIAAGGKTPWDQLSAETSEDEDQNEGLEDAEPGDFPTTELEQISTSVTDVVNCLLRLSVSIRNPAPHDRFVESLRSDTSHFEPYDIGHVREAFNLLEEYLVERLGKANSRRRQYFEYRKNHHDKLAYGLEDAGDIAAQSTIASSIPEQLKDHISAIQAPRVFEDDHSESGATQTSFATAADSKNRRVPSLPEAAYLGPFECPFCFMMISVTGRASWKEHVFDDLRPYICLTDNCNAPEQEFSRRHHWIQHIKQHHWSLYICPSGCGQSFSSIELCAAHLRQEHLEEMVQVETELRIKLAARPLDATKGVACPFCGSKLTSLETYGRHVGRNQQNLSLFALPLVDAAGEEKD